MGNGAVARVELLACWPSGWWPLHMLTATLSTVSAANVLEVRWTIVEVLGTRWGPVEGLHWRDSPSRHAGLIAA